MPLRWRNLVLWLSLAAFRVANTPAAVAVVLPFAGCHCRAGLSSDTAVRPHAARAAPDEPIASQGRPPVTESTNSVTVLEPPPPSRPPESPPPGAARAGRVAALLGRL